MAGVAGCASTHDGHAHWGYSGKEGPAKWGELSPDFKLCSTGLTQSPIDLPAPPMGAQPEQSPRFGWVKSKVTLKNNGHAIQADYPGGGSLEFAGKTYKVLQFHFHTPSEHTVAGEAYPLEMHAVHKNEQGELAVVGFLFQLGDENGHLAELFNLLPLQAGQSVPGPAVDLTHLLPEKRTGTTFLGSLTTPPCSEGVRWLVLSQVGTVSSAQVKALNELTGENARPVQPLKDRPLAAF